MKKITEKLQTAFWICFWMLWALTAFAMFCRVVYAVGKFLAR